MAEESRKCNAALVAIFLQFGVLLAALQSASTDDYEELYDVIGPLDDNTCVYYTGSNVSLVLYEGTCEQVDACKFDICSDTWGLAWSVSVSLGAAVALATGLMKYCHEQTPPENDDQWNLVAGLRVFTMLCIDFTILATVFNKQYLIAGGAGASLISEIVDWKDHKDLLPPSKAKEPSSAASSGTAAVATSV